MEIDWDLVKKKTLWQYEELIEKILEVLDYGFVQEHYGHTMEEAASYSEKIQQNYLQSGREATFIIEIINYFTSRPTPLQQTFTKFRQAQPIGSG